HRRQTNERIATCQTDDSSQRPLTGSPQGRVRATRSMGAFRPVPSNTLPGSRGFNEGRGAVSGHFGGPRGLLFSGFATLPLIVGGLSVGGYERLRRRLSASDRRRIAR